MRIYIYIYIYIYIVPLIKERMSDGIVHKKKILMRKGRQPKTMYRCSSVPRLTKEGDHEKKISKRVKKFQVG